MDENEVLRRRLARERTARKEAERIAEEKTRELYSANTRLSEVNDRLHEMVEERTAELVKMRDQAIAANRAKSAFLANMSHELRTPLNAVIGYSEIIQEEHEGGDEAMLADVRKIHSAGKHLLTLINDVLDLSKIEAGKMTTFNEDLDVEGFLADVVETLRPVQAQSNNAFAWTCEADVGAVYTDAVKLRQVLFNLLSNAFKFTEKGEVSLRAWREAEGGSSSARLWFEVRDTGIGISASQLSHLFSPFSQGDSSTTRRFGGTGLGLALSQKFCAILGGEILVDSNEGRGSTFRFWIPARASSVAVPSLDAAEPAALGRGPGTRGTVLVVDDDVAVHDLLSRYLADTGFRVVCTADPSQALALARDLQPSAVVLDVLMPQRDGWAVLTDLKADPTVADIPVILLSMIDERGFGFALGAADYLVKPVPRGRLLQVLRKHADCSRGRRVLVVEDEPALRSLVCRALVSDGWEVAEAENGRVALEKVADGMPALVLLDLMMPEMDGFGFVGELHRMPGGREVPIVVMTAKDLTDEDVAFFRTNAQVVLRKNVYSRDELLGVLRELVERNATRAGAPG